MKKLVVVAVLVIAAVALVRAKFVEQDANLAAANDYFIALCGRDAACSDRLVRFRPCFGGAYRLSLRPGADVVDLDALVSCLSGSFPVPALEAARNAEAPFPSSRAR